MPIDETYCLRATATAMAAPLWSQKDGAQSTTHLAVCKICFAPEFQSEGMVGVRAPEGRAGKVGGSGMLHTGRSGGLG